MAEPTSVQIDELLRFLPDIEANAGGLDPPLQGSTSRPTHFIGFNYPDWVRGFFKVAAQPHWTDYDYDPTRTSILIRDSAAVSSATFAQIRTMLTFCVRGERFCDGHWAAMIREGRISALLRRLLELRNSFSKDHE